MRSIPGLVRQYGLIPLATRAALRPFRPLVTVNRVLFYVAHPTASDQPGEIAVTIADSHQIVELAATGALRRPPSLVQQRIGQGHDCVLVTGDAGQVLGYGWIAYGSHNEDSLALRLTLSADEVFLYDFFVDSLHRGTGLYPRMLRAILSLVSRAKEGRRVYIATQAENRASKRGIEKAGFRRAGTVLFCRLGSWSWRRIGPTGVRAPDYPWTRRG